MYEHFKIDYDKSHTKNKDTFSLFGELLMANSHNALGGGVLNVSGLKDTLPVATILRVGDPDGLLGVIGLGLVGSLHLDVGEQELRGVGVHCALHQLDMAGHDGWCFLSSQYPGVYNQRMN